LGNPFSPSPLFLFSLALSFFPNWRWLYLGASPASLPLLGFKTGGASGRGAARLQAAQGAGAGARVRRERAALACGSARAWALVAPGGARRWRRCWSGASGASRRGRARLGRSRSGARPRLPELACRAEEVGAHGGQAQLQELARRREEAGQRGGRERPQHATLAVLEQARVRQLEEEE
jgi:hypothetical protein